jgi:hypothetical protein
MTTRMPRWIALGGLAALLAGGAPRSAHAAHADDLTCSMRFNMSGWSALYKTSQGTGTVSCSNGETAKVQLHSVGGGLVAGKSTLDNGKGEFTGVRDIRDIFGDYASAGGEAGAVKTAEGTVVSKGEVNLALSGTGRGWDLGVSINKFSIQPLEAK